MSAYKRVALYMYVALSLSGTACVWLTCGMVLGFIFGSVCCAFPYAFTKGEKAKP